MVDRIPFSRVEAETLTVMRRLGRIEAEEAGCGSMATPVGIFGRIMHAKNSLIAVVEFDDLFDAEGNRFYND